MDWVVDIAATCTVDGRKHRACSNCDHTEVAVIPATGHKEGEPKRTREPTCTVPSEYAVYCTACNVELSRYEEDGEFAEHIPDGGRVTKEPTCTAKGVYTYKCRECNNVTSATEIPAKGHSYGSPYYSNVFSNGYGQTCTVCGSHQELDYVECEHPASAYHESVIIQPTCTELGSKTCSCDVCRKTWTVSIPVLDHSYTSKVIAPTCTEKGYTKYTCSRCGHWYTDNETDPNGHNFAGGWYVTKAATCTETGTERKTCLTCGYYEERTIPANGHAYTSKVTDPTCTAKGYTTYTCSVCGHSYKDNETVALGHKDGDHVRVRDATCTVPAEYAVYCTRCSVMLYRYEDDGEFAEHIADGGRITKYATCTETGTYTYRCRECNTWLRDEVIDALGHDYEYDHTVDATCDEGGYDVYTCIRCDDYYTTNDTDPNGHDFSGGWVTDVEPNCTESGTEYRVCGNCAEVETRDVDPLGHDWEYYPDSSVSSEWSRVCNRCGEIEEDVPHG